MIINDRNEVLLSDEMRFGRSFTKFPGGGLEWGEGLANGLKRELKEELDIEAEIGALFYVNDFFQQSGFRKDDQLFSFYYRAHVIDLDAIPFTEHDVPVLEEGEKFRWFPIDELSEAIFTFPIDKIVAMKLKEEM